MTKLNRSTAHRATLAASCSLLLASCASVPPAQKPPRHPAASALRAAEGECLSELRHPPRAGHDAAAHRDPPRMGGIPVLRASLRGATEPTRALQGAASHDAGARRERRAAAPARVMGRGRDPQARRRGRRRASARAPRPGPRVRRPALALPQGTPGHRGSRLVPGPSARSSARPGSGIYRGLAAAYRTLGDQRRSQEMLDRAGLASRGRPPRPPRARGSLGRCGEGISLRREAPRPRGRRGVRRRRVRLREPRVHRRGQVRGGHRRGHDGGVGARRRGGVATESRKLRSSTSS